MVLRCAGQPTQRRECRRPCGQRVEHEYPLKMIPIRVNRLPGGLVRLPCRRSIENRAVRGIRRRCRAVCCQPRTDRAWTPYRGTALWELPIHDPRDVAVQLRLPRPVGQGSDAGETRPQELVDIATQPHIGDPADLHTRACQHRTKRNLRGADASLTERERPHQHADDAPGARMHPSTDRRIRRASEKKLSTRRVGIDSAPNSVPDRRNELPLVNEKWMGGAADQ